MNIRVFQICFLPAFIIFFYFSIKMYIFLNRFRKYYNIIPTSVNDYKESINIYDLIFNYRKKDLKDVPQHLINEGKSVFLLGISYMVLFFLGAVVFAVLFEIF